MKQALNALLFAMLTCMGNVAFAGMPAVSYTYALGFDFFFSWHPNQFNRSEVVFESSEELQKLYAHCQMGKPVFDLLASSKNKCSIDISKTEKGDANWDSAMIEILGTPKYTGGSPAFGLFSTTELPAAKWQQRPADERERSAIQQLLSAAKNPNWPDPHSLNINSAWVVFLPDAAVRTYFVPGSQINESFYDATRHHVFTSTGGVFRYQGEISDKPIHYVNSGRDDSPLVVTNEDCDGLCVELWSLSSGTKTIATFGGH